MCSAKFFDDHYFNNAYYSKVGGVPVAELNCLELEFLALINFELFIRLEDFKKFYSEIGNESLHRNCHCVRHYWENIPTSIHKPPLCLSSKQPNSTPKCPNQENSQSSTKQNEQECVQNPQDKDKSENPADKDGGEILKRLSPCQHQQNVPLSPKSSSKRAVPSKPKSKGLCDECDPVVAPSADAPVPPKIGSEKQRSSAKHGLRRCTSMESISDSPRGKMRTGKFNIRRSPSWGSTARMQLRAHRAEAQIRTCMSIEYSRSNTHIQNISA